VTTNQQAECGICARRSQDEARGFVYQDEHWYAQPPARQAVPGQLMLVAKRHFLDASEMDADEAGSLGSVLGRLTSAIKQAVGAERVYVVTVVERTPHWHTWLIPRAADSATRGTAYLNTVLTGGLSATDGEAARAAAALQAVLA
jgi:diadenosine tetraphosphate (Ap4A) HIT family hydrolase